MKLRLLTYTTITLLLISCSKEESTQIEDANVETFTSVIENKNRTPIFTCNPSWEASRTFPNQSGDLQYYIFYSNDPTDYGLPATATITEADINCVRQEYFANFCGMYLHTFQPTNIFEDAWIRRISLCGEVKDDVETATNSDDRVCTGSNCD